MQSKKLRYIIIFFIIVFLLNLYISNISSAYDAESALGSLENYGQITGNSDIFQDKVGRILRVIQIVGSLVAIIALIVLGVKYMMGTIEEKAEYKKTLLPYFIGAMMVFGISNLLEIVYLVAIGAF